MISLKPLSYCLAFLCLCLLKNPCLAQDMDKVKHTLDKVSPADFVLPSTPIIDSNTHAVILSDQGEVHYIGNKKGWFSYVYTRHTKIKILDKTAFDLAKVVIALRDVEKEGDMLSNVQAAAYNLENGQIVQSNLDQKDVFYTKENKYYKSAKFSLPGVKEGSILQYTYTIISE